MIKPFKILKQAKTVIVDGSYAPDQDLSSIPDEVSNVLWNGDSGLICYTSDPVTGLPQPIFIDSAKPYSSIIEAAEKTIFAKEHPKFFYRTVSPVGEEIIVTAVDWPQPPNSTPEKPPAKPHPNCSLYWTGSDWVWLPFPFGSTLSEAQSYLCQQVDNTAYSILSPTDWMAAKAFETNTPVPKEWLDWRQSVREEALSKRTVIGQTKKLQNLADYAVSEAYFAWSPQPS
jgi:hypothetical protein